MLFANLLIGVILNASDCMKVLAEKFNQLDYVDPIYSFQNISLNNLEEIRQSLLRKVYETVEGTQGFHIIIFQPHGNYDLSSKQLCVCPACLDYNFLARDHFSKI